MRAGMSPSNPNAKTKKTWSTLLDTWEDTGTDQRDTLGMRKDPTAMAKGRGKEDQGG